MFVGSNPAWSLLLDYLTAVNTTTFTYIDTDGPCFGNDLTFAKAHVSENRVQGRILAVDCGDFVVVPWCTIDSSHLPFLSHN